MCDLDFRLRRMYHHPKSCIGGEIGGAQKTEEKENVQKRARSFILSWCSMFSQYDELSRVRNQCYAITGEQIRNSDSGSKRTLADDLPPFNFAIMCFVFTFNIGEATVVSCKQGGVGWRFSACKAMPSELGDTTHDETLTRFVLHCIALPYHSIDFRQIRSAMIQIERVKKSENVDNPIKNQIKYQIPNINVVRCKRVACLTVLSRRYE